MSVDTIGDFLTIIRNGVMRSKRSVVAPFSAVKVEIARVLKDEGFIRDFEVVGQGPVKKDIKVLLKYVEGESVIHEITRRSRPGRRHYEKIARIRPIIGKLGISIFTTNKGVMTDKQARDARVGGELICSVW